MFNENKFYDFSEFDLFQLITEPMIETIFEISQHFRNILSFIEIDSDDEVVIIDVNAFENVNCNPLIQLTKQLKRSLNFIFLHLKLFQHLNLKQLQAFLMQIFSNFTNKKRNMTFSLILTLQTFYLKK